MHSHNDYLRAVPLYTALAAGATGIEADIFIRPSTASSHRTNTSAPTPNDLQVAHSHYTLDPQRTLQNLYLAPLLKILSSSSTSPKSIFQDTPGAGITLMLDFKESTAGIFELVETQLGPLRDAGFLTTWEAGKGRVDRQVTVVASGDAKLEWVMRNSTYRDVFLDAPLMDIASPLYNNTNSHYASVDIGKSLGYLVAGQYSKKQHEKVQAQVKAAQDKGLKARYWGTVDWPRKWMLITWRVLAGYKVGMLNVDDVEMASRWVEW